MKPTRMSIEHEKKLYGALNEVLPPIEYYPVLDKRIVPDVVATELFCVDEEGTLRRCFTNPDMIVSEHG